MSLYYFAGTVTEQSTAVSGASIYVYLESTGEFINSTTSSGDGSFYVTTTTSAAHFLVCVPPSGLVGYNDLVYGDLYPVTVSGM